MSKTLAEQLVGMLPEDWLAELKGGVIVYRPIPGLISAALYCKLGEDESPYIINWALDELAKSCFGVTLESCGEGTWRVRYLMQHEGKEHVMGIKTSKTLALAHALVALGEVNG